MFVPIFFLCLATYVNGKLCETQQFWSSVLERCENCSRCIHPDIVLRPCQEHTDTVCGPLSELNIDWTWLKNQGSHSKGNSRNENIQKEMLETFRENFNQIRQHEKHMRERQKYMKHQHEGHTDEGLEENIHKFEKNNHEKDIWNKLKFLNKHRTLEEKVSDDVTSMNGKFRNHLETVAFKKWEKIHRGHPDSDGMSKYHRFEEDEAFEPFKSHRKKEKQEKNQYDPNHLKFDENGILIKNFGFTKIEDTVKMEKLVDDSKFIDDFSSTEKFILDGQTVILGIAVSSCIIFFLVAAMYSTQHAKHWKKLRNYFDADVDELQAWISSKNSKSKVPPSRIYKTTTEVVHTEGSQCKYLERIIKMNGKNKFNFVTGNVYEKDNKLPVELKPLTTKYLPIQKDPENRI